jgi:CubicO group peptidase (beta-lactamase class C family)
MQDTYFFVPTEKRQRIAALYEYNAGKLKRVEAEEPAERSKIPSPAGRLVSTANDLLQVNEMMREKGTLAGRRVLSRAAVELMTASHTGDIKAGWVPGLGMALGTRWCATRPERFVTTLSGFVKGGAYRTYEWVDPEKKLVGVILMQRTNGGGDVSDEINSFMAMSAVASSSRHILTKL